MPSTKRSRPTAPPDASCHSPWRYSWCTRPRSRTPMASCSFAPMYTAATPRSGSPWNPGGGRWRNVSRPTNARAWSDEACVMGMKGVPEESSPEPDVRMVLDGTRLLAVFHDVVFDDTAVDVIDRNFGEHVHQGRLISHEERDLWPNAQAINGRKALGS